MHKKSWNAFQIYAHKTNVKQIVYLYHILYIWDKILFITAIAFMHTTTELTVHLAAPTVRNLERLFSL